MDEKLNPRVDSLWVYPIKGLHGFSNPHVDLTETGFPADRRFAFVFSKFLNELSDVTQQKQSSEFPKNQLLVQNDWPMLAAISVQWHQDSVVGLSVPGASKTFNLEIPEERQSISKWVLKLLMESSPSPSARNSVLSDLTLLGSSDSVTRFPDRPKDHLSLLNISTLRMLEQKMNRSLNLNRFRANIVIEGMQPWDELGFLGKKIQIGESVLEVTKPIVRCFNINVEPDSGSCDLNLLENLKVLTQDSTPYKNPLMGVMARVVQKARIKTGDSVFTS